MQIKKHLPTTTRRKEGITCLSNRFAWSVADVRRAALAGVVGLFAKRNDLRATIDVVDIYEGPGVGVGNKSCPFSSGSKGIAFEY